MPKKRNPDLIGGVFAALATPRRANTTEIDTSAFFDYQDAVSASGVNGLVLFGSTGEFVHFGVPERMQAVSLLIKRSRIPVLVNVSHSTFDGATALAEHAVDSGAQGVLIMPPYFYRYSEAQILSFYQRFAEFMAGRTRLFLYNLPFFTNDIAFSTIESLLNSGLYAGIKDSSGDAGICERLASLHAATQFLWFAGNERLYLQARSSGADGMVSGVAAAIPELIVALNRAIASNSMEQAMHLNGLLAEFLAWIDKFPGTVGIKQAAVSRRWKLDHFSLPLDERTAAEVTAFRSWLSDWLLGVLAECEKASVLKA